MVTLPRAIRIPLLSLAAGALAYGVALVLPARYGSYATFYFPLNQTSLSPMQAFAAGGTSDGGTVMSLGGALLSPVVASAPQSAMGILESSELRRAVVDELQLAKRWELSRVRAVDRLSKLVDVRVDRHGFLRVEATADSPEVSVQLVEAYTRHLSTLADKLTLNVSRRNRLFIEGKLKESSRELSAKERLVAQAMSRSFQSDPEALRTLYMNLRAKLAEIEAQSTASAASLREIDSGLKKLYKTGKGFPSAALAMDELARRLSERRIALEDARTSFVEGAPERKIAEDQAASLDRVTAQILEAQRRAAEQTPDAPAAKLRSELRGLEASAREYTRKLGGLERQLVEEPARYIELQRAQRELEAAVKAHGALQAEHQAAVIAESRDPGRFEVVDQPYSDDRPVSPKKGLMALTAAFGVFLLQVMLVLYRRARVVEPEAETLLRAA